MSHRVTKKMVTFCLSLVSWSCGAQSLALHQKDKVLAGVVELTSDGGKVRILFARSAQGWAAFARPCPDLRCLKSVAGSYPSSVRWSLLPSGQSSPVVWARAPAHYARYIDQGLQDISAPHSNLSEGTLASTLPTLTDPDHWGAAHLRAEDTASVRMEFRRNFPSVKNCRIEGQSPTKEETWTFKDGDLTIRSSLASADGWRLVQLVLTPFRCDGVVADAFLPQWFAVAPGYRAKRLDVAGMRFVGAADLDGDGASEMLFGSREEGSAYVLYTSHFESTVSVRFSAH